jgi:hypothetical protein
MEIEEEPQTKESETTRLIHMAFSAYHSIKTPTNINSVYLQKTQKKISLLHETFSNLHLQEYHSSLFCKSETKLIYSDCATIAKSAKDLAQQSKISLDIGAKNLPEFYNFYHDPLIAEVKLVMTPSIRIVKKCLELIVEFGPNPLIDDIVNVAHYLLHLKCDSPLMKAMTGLELLLTKMEEYETMASKRLNSIADMIVLIK